MFTHYQQQERPRRIRPALLALSIVAVFASLTVFMWGARLLLEAFGYRFELAPIEITYDPFEDGTPAPDDPEELD